jgi:exonuclease III
MYIVGGLNTPLSSIDRTSRQKISKDILQVNNNYHKMDLSDIYRLLHPTTAGYTFFSADHGTFSIIPIS